MKAVKAHVGPAQGNAEQELGIELAEIAPVAGVHRYRGAPDGGATVGGVGRDVEAAVK